LFFVWRSAARRRQSSACHERQARGRRKRLGSFAMSRMPSNRKRQSSSFPSWRSRLAAFFTTNTDGLEGPEHGRTLLHAEGSCEERQPLATRPDSPHGHFAGALGVESGLWTHCSVFVS